MKKLIFVMIALFIVSFTLQAHVPYIEENDFSFESPFLIPIADDGGPTNVMRSKAIFAYLDNNDIDVYTFTLIPSDFQKPVLDANGNPTFDENGGMIMQYSPVLITANALPPACRQYKNFYPQTALVGPGLETAPDNLPFTVPEGHGAVVCQNPRVKERPVMTEVGIWWFLPKGLSQDCLYNSPWSCDYTNTISQPVFNPGTYNIVIFNSTGRPGDYTASIGILEGFDPPKTAEQEAILERVVSGEWYRLPCVPVKAAQ
ncbi:MAG: hypothetical protein GY765_22745 [bacterium]|nr:hypothetical protein [bacterium]